MVLHFIFDCTIDNLYGTTGNLIVFVNVILINEWYVFSVSGIIGSTNDTATPSPEIIQRMTELYLDSFITDTMDTTR